MLVCPCGHKGPFPENSVRLVCSSCQRVHQVEWVHGRDAINEYRQYLTRVNPTAPTYQIQYVEPAEGRA